MNDGGEEDDDPDGQDRNLVSSNSTVCNKRHHGIYIYTTALNAYLIYATTQQAS